MAGDPSLDHAQREDVRVLGNDLTYVFLPHHAQVAKHVAEFGRLPLWDTSGFAGRPMVGNPQGGLFYPPVWLVWWSRSPAALGWLTVGHLIWAGLGVYVLLRSLRAGRVASTVAAGCFQASPYVLAHTFEGHYPHVWATCWYPWAFWAFVQYRRGRPRGTLLLAPMLALMFLCGHLQEWYYLVFALSAWAVVDACRALRARRGHAALVALAVWAGILAVSLGLVAIELMPDLAAQGWTLRSGRLALARVSRYQLHALNLFQLLGPTALGGPDSYFGPDNFWETILSIGLVPLVLAAVAVMRHPDRPVVRSWMVLVVISVMFAAGRRLGLFTLLFELVPGMNRFRVPSRSLFLANLGAAVLAGLGVEALERLADAREDWRSWNVESGGSPSWSWWVWSSGKASPGDPSPAPSSRGHGVPPVSCPRRARGQDDRRRSRRLESRASIARRKSPSSPADSSEGSSPHPGCSRVGCSGSP